MKPLLWLLIASLLAGCTISEPRQHATLQSLREYRAARMADDARARLTVTVRDARVSELGLSSGISEDQRSRLRTELAQNGRILANQYGLRQLDDYPLPSLGMHVYIFEASNNEQVARVMTQLEQEPDVQSVQRMSLYRTQAAATAPPVRPASDMEDVADPLAPLQIIPGNFLRSLHQFSTGEGVTIVVIDTGIDVDHADLLGADLLTRDLVNERAHVPAENHATAVAGLILAQPDNGVGLRGIAPDARVIVLRACWQEFELDAAFCNTFTLAKALSAALEAEADIVNLSLTGPMDPLLSQLVARLVADNIIVVAANRDERDQGPFPSTLPGIIAATGRPLLARNPGPVFAPGTDILSLLPSDRYGFHDGSSISAAQVAGIASLFRARDRSISATVVQSLLHGEGIEQEGLPGLLDALAAVGID